MGFLAMTRLQTDESPWYCVGEWKVGQPHRAPPHHTPKLGTFGQWATYIYMTIHVVPACVAHSLSRKCTNKQTNARSWHNIKPYQVLTPVISSEP